MATHPINNLPNPPATKPPASKRNKNTYGEPQARFIEKTRGAINLDPTFLKKNDWKRISFLRGKQPRGISLTTETEVNVDSFYIKDLAVWIPHQIIPNHMPSCPFCKKNKFVQATSSWVARPKILYGVRKHRYLDTIYYKCHASSCNKKFSGTNQKSMEADGGKVLGLFNFYLTAGFAVDEELYSYIVNHSKETTAAIYRQLAQMACDEWCDDAFYYYRAVQADKVKKTRTDALPHDSGQRTLDAHLVPQNESRAAKERRGLTLELARVKRALVAKKQSFDSDFEFITVFNMKKNRNGIGLPFKGIGRQKLLKLIGLGITSARELLDYDEENPAVLPQWRRIVADYYDSLERDINRLQKQVDKIEEDLEWNSLALEIDNDGSGESSERERVDSNTAPIRKAPPFSPMMDGHRYNARVISKSSIDRIIVSDFQRRKPIQDDAMRSIKAQVLKIDWHYKLPGKIKVYTGRGESFSPFKSCVSIQNEDAQTLFWKCYPCAEGVETMRPDLERLKERFNIIQGHQPKVCYVDNCCIVKSKLKAIFGQELLVKLDCFHWCKRWDGLLYDTNSAEASIFRGLIHNALFIVEKPEYNRVKFVLRGKLGRPPTDREVFKEAKSTIPDADTLEKRVNAVLQYVLFSDLTLEMPEAAVNNPPNGAQERPKRFFKPSSDDVRRLIKNQMDHVTKGCLSDPHKSVVAIHRINPVTQAGFSARSTGTNENDNMFLNRLLNTPSVGIPRALRVISDHYEISNLRRRIKRLGEEEPITHRSEKLYALNSVATSCGYSEEDLPVKEKVSVPTAIKELIEYIGMHFKLPDAFSEEDTGTDEGDENDQQDLVDFMTGVDFEEGNDDVPVDPSAYEQSRQIADQVEPNPVDDQASLEKCLAIHLPMIKPNETTFQAFTRMTNERPWVPFKKTSSPKTAVDKEEYQLFDSMQGDYDRHGAYLHARRGYGSFEKAWDIEVANRFKAKAAGDKSVILIHRKTALQLQQHFDALNLSRDHAAHMRPNDAFRSRMEDVLRNTRRNMPQRQEAFVCQPQTYHQNGRASFGNPLPLNADIAAAAFQHNNSRTSRQVAPFQLRPIRPSLPILLGRNFNRNRFCWKCGFQKKLHNDYGVPFGHACKDNCLREDCSKCGERREFHNGIDNMGPYCLKAPYEGSPFHEWYANRNGPNHGLI